MGFPPVVGVWAVTAAEVFEVFRSVAPPIVALAVATVGGIEAGITASDFSGCVIEVVTVVLR